MDNKLDRIGSMTGACVRSPGETDFSYGQYLESTLRNHGETRLRFWARVYAELKATDDRIKEMEVLASQVNAKHEDYKNTIYQSPVYTLKGVSLETLAQKKNPLQNKTYDPKTVTIKLNGMTFDGIYVDDWKLPKLPFASEDTLEPIDLRTKSEIWSDELRRKLKERAAAPENNLTMCFGYEGDDY